jgi:hypothetical protein
MIGVLTGTEVLLVEAAQGKSVLRSILLPPEIDEPSGLLEHLWQLGLTSVWVMPATTLSRTATCAWFEQFNGRWVAVVHPHPSEPDRPLCALLWPKGSGLREARRLTFVFPEYAGWDWELPDARTLLATVTYLDQTLARSVNDSPDLVAHQLLTDLTSDQAVSWLRSSPVNLHNLPAKDEASIPVTESAPDLVWMRPLTLVEQRQRYLHKYNHISLHLQACTAVRLGVGTPEFSANGRAYDGIRPGVWHVHAEQTGSIFDGKRLPQGLDGEWISTPQVKCCQDIGYRVYVQEGYYWSQSHEPLKRWATTLWQAAERLHTNGYRHRLGRANASHAIKQLAELGVTALAREENDGGWGRPDWKGQIVGRSRAILFAHLATLARKGVMPALGQRDALWVVSDDPNPLTAIYGILTAQRWRGFFVGYEVPLPLSSEVKAIFSSSKSPEQAAMALDTLAGVSSR